MTIEKTIKKAIEGGWSAKGILNKDMACIESIDKLYGEIVVNFQWVKYDHKKQPCKMTREMMIHEILLDPSFWKAIYHVIEKEEWESARDIDKEYYENTYVKEKMHELADHLAEGKTAEDYFKEL